MVLGGTIEGLARLGRQAMVALTWILIVIALALATWTTITSGRAQELGGADIGRLEPYASERLPAPGWAQPAFSNQNVSGR